MLVILHPAESSHFQTRGKGVLFSFHSEPRSPESSACALGLFCMHGFCNRFDTKCRQGDVMVRGQHGIIMLRNGPKTSVTMFMAEKVCPHRVVPESLAAIFRTYSLEVPPLSLPSPCKTLAHSVELTMPSLHTTNTTRLAPTLPRANLCLMSSASCLILLPPTVEDI